MIYCAQDVVDHLLTAVGGGAQDGEARAVRQAVINGVREVLQARNWLWHTKTNYFATTRLSTTASVISVGSPTITVASTDSMAVGRLLDISPTYFTTSPRVVSINSPTSVTVDQNAKAALPSGTTPVLIQTYYDLPDDLKDMDVLVTNTVGTLHTYITPQEWQRLEVNTRGAGEPYYYTVMRSDLNPDRWQIRFVGVPTDGTPVYYTYRYEPKLVKYLGYEPSCRQGTATIGSGTPQPVTGSITAFKTDMAGAVIRFGTANTEADPLGALSPYVSQGRIKAVATSTSLTLQAPVEQAAGVKYAISDVIDCSSQMYSAILTGVEYWYARLSGKTGDDINKLFNRDLRLAMERDVISPMSGRPSGISYPTPRSAGWYSPQQADQGA
jgi:hypothetical protein